jgi:hypothetical protein
VIKRRRGRGDYNNTVKSLILLEKRRYLLNKSTKVKRRQ